VSRMVFRERRARKEVLLNVTSLVDVLFLLLIFFMLTGTFKRVGEMELRLPPSTTSTPEASNPAHQADLVLRENGSMSLDGESVDLPHLKGRLEELLKQDPDTQVTIKAEEKVEHGDVVRLLDIVRDAGFKGVGLGTQMKRD
jgi:biopolymer transport protein ExbD